MNEYFKICIYPDCAGKVTDSHCAIRMVILRGSQAGLYDLYLDQICIARRAGRDASSDDNAITCIEL